MVVFIQLLTSLALVARVLRLVSGLFLLCVFLEGAGLTTDGSIDQVPKTMILLRQISSMRLIDALKLCAGSAR